jgi:hypothetical protein
VERTPLTMESRTGGQDVIYKEIKQRVRRTCHQCQTIFKGHSTVCESCGHIRCRNCPREPYVPSQDFLSYRLLIKSTVQN